MKRDGDTRERVVAATLRIVEKMGPDAVTMRRVAGAVGVTAMALYHHFPDRDGLLRAAADAESARITALFDGRRTSGPAIRRLRAMAKAYVDYALGRPRLFAFLFLNDRPGVRRFPADFDPRRPTMLNRTAETIAEAMLDGALRKADFWDVAVDLWAFVHGHVALYRGGRYAFSEPEFRTFFRRSLDRFLKGLAR
jgi:AcrR family transcriptional regulator